MSNLLMGAQMFSAAVQGFGQYQQAKAQARVQRAVQNYRNSVSEIQAGRALNTLQTNENRIRSDYVRTNLSTQQSAAQDRANAEVSAAAAGVTGGSVQGTMRDLEASFSMAMNDNARIAGQRLQDIDSQRSNVRMSAILGKDIQVIPQPSAGAALLGIGANLLNIYDSHQPGGLGGR